MNPLTSPLVVTSITNFILASELFFLAGMSSQMPKKRFSAAWYWAWALFLLALGALIGGVDHGFFEINPGADRYWIQRCNWFVLGLVTFAMLMTTVTQFFGRRLQQVFLWLGLAQLAIYSAIVFSVDSFLTVIVNYAPVMLWLLVMNLIGLRRGAGSWAMIAGIVLIFAASGIQAAGVDTFNPVDRNGLYHLISMVGVFFLWLGGKRLKT